MAGENNAGEEPEVQGPKQSGGIGCLPILLIAMVVLIGAGFGAIYRFRDDNPETWQFMLDVWGLISEQ